MDFFSRIVEANGWTITAVGMGTVFVVLTVIWFFITGFSKAMCLITSRSAAAVASSKPCEIRVVDEKYVYNQDTDPAAPPQLDGVFQSLKRKK